MQPDFTRMIGIFFARNMITKYITPVGCIKTMRTGIVTICSIVKWCRVSLTSC